MNNSYPKAVMIQSLENACGFNAYRKTLTLFDIDYQKNFNGYYRVRRDSSWLKTFYDYMEKNKNNTDITFEDILCKLYSIPHNTTKDMATTVEASFSGKILATINPNNPV